MAATVPRNTQQNRVGIVQEVKQRPLRKDRSRS